MNKGMRRMVALACGALTMTCLAMAQGGPAPKSAKERDAIIAVQNAKTPDERLTAIENVLTHFADTQFKVILLQMAVDAAQRKGDYTAITLYCERLLEADPKSVLAEVTLASEIARHTREFDLDKEEKLTKADKYAHAALDNAPTVPKPQPNIPDEQWEGAKKDFAAQAHSALGMIAGLRKDYNHAIAEYSLAISGANQVDPADYVRLGQADMNAGKFDDANAALDKAIADPKAGDQVKQVAQETKAQVAKRRAAEGSAPAPPKQ